MHYLGSSRGIGLGLVSKLLNQSTAKVIATCRSPASASALQQLSQAFPDRLTVLPLDVVSQQDHIALRDTLVQRGINSIDVVIANAGVNSVGLNGDPATKTPLPEMNRIFETNVLGVMNSFQVLQDLVLASKTRVFVVISSLMGSISSVDARQYGGSTAYRTSKAAVNMFSVCFANDAQIKSAGAKVLCLHPGWVQTDMGGAGGRKADIEVEDCTEGLFNILEITSNMQTNPSRKTEEVDPKYQAMYAVLQEKSVVYADYKGDVLPW